MSGVAAGVGRVVPVGGGIVIIAVLVADENGLGEPDVGAAAVVGSRCSGLEKVGA